MPTEILMPALSPTMEEGTLAKWLVKEGDTVASGDILAEIETDKATMEFEAVDEGVIGKILVAEGTEGVKVNTPIAVLLEDGESADDIGSTPAPAAAAPAAETPPPRPNLPPRRPPRPHRRHPPPPMARASSPRRWRAGSRRTRVSTSPGQGLRPAWPHREGRCGGRNSPARRRSRARSPRPPLPRRRRQRHAHRPAGRAGPQCMRAAI
jgi:pyruvate dehydrogenase E2 component (dihydrolipoamide acetyltransferase)